VYAVRAHGLGPTPLNGVASLGVRPTVTEAGRLLLETHLFDCRIDAYGKLISIEFSPICAKKKNFRIFPQ